MKSRGKGIFYEKYTHKSKTKEGDTLIHDVNMK